MLKTDTMPAACAYLPTGEARFAATAYTRGPWNPAHQHAGPPIALICRSLEQAAALHGLTHLARLTANLLRPIPVGELNVGFGRAVGCRSRGRDAP